MYSTPFTQVESFIPLWEWDIPKKKKKKDGKGKEKAKGSVDSGASTPINGGSGATIEELVDSDSSRPGSRIEEVKDE